MNLRGIVWKELCQKIMKIALLRGIQFIESSKSCDITMFQAMKIPDAQAAVDKE